jgi:protein-disulfide isomerase
MTGVIVVLALLLSGGAQESAREALGSQPAAIVEGQPIQNADIDAFIKAEPGGQAQLMELQVREHQLRSDALAALIAQKLIVKEAAARGLTPEALVKAEVEDKAVVTEAEAKAYYDANKARMPKDMTEAVAIGQILKGMGQQRQRERHAAFAHELRAKYAVKVLLEPYRVAIEAGHAPIRGNPNAPVTVIEFSDFQCPYCIRARPTVNRVREAYGDKVRWVFRHFPLAFHNEAEKAAEAAACAGDQGKFWEMHDRLWASNGKLPVVELKALATAIGLDKAAFDSCLDSGKRADLVKQDAEAGGGYGVSGTPAFFVDGRPLVGAQPFEAFQQVIDDELARLPGAKASALAP